MVHCSTKTDEEGLTVNTAKKEAPVSANGEGNGSTVATTDTPMRTRRTGETGAFLDPNIPQEQENDNKNSELNQGAKMVHCSTHHATLSGNTKFSRKIRLDYGNTFHQ